MVSELGPDQVVMAGEKKPADQVVMAGEKKPAGGSSSDGIVRVIREVGCGSSYAVLTKTNYSDWALLMKVKLKARAL